MSNSLYDNYFGNDSNYKVKDENNFDIGSFDANNMSEQINKTIGSGKKEEENTSIKFIKNDTKFQQKDTISEHDEHKLENSKMNNTKYDDRISKNTESEKEKEEEESIFKKKK